MITNNLSNYFWLLSCPVSADELKKWISDNHADDAFDLFSDAPVWEVIPGNSTMTTIACLEQSTFTLCKQFAAELSTVFPEITVHALWLGRSMHEPVNYVTYQNGKSCNESGGDAYQIAQQLLGIPIAREEDPGREYLVLPGTSWEECRDVLAKLQIDSGRFQHWHNDRGELVVYDPLNASALGAFKFSRNLPDRKIISITGNVKTGRYFYTLVINRQEMEREGVTPDAIENTILQKKYGIITTNDLSRYFGLSL